jgi:site-specific DNA-methyltransferase (adenine-specific)
MNIIHGDSLDKLKELEDNSIDSIVTDPPYGLSFMGKKWDYDVPSQEIWEECLRVLKPGGYLLAFAGTRTQHRMAVRIEDAGFEIRDMIAWVYGSGFPKSLNIGKVVDKLQGNEREVIGDNIRLGDKKPYVTNNNPDNQTSYKSVYPTKGKLTKGTSPYEGWGTALKPALEPITVARKPLSEKTVAENVLKYGTGGINIDGCRVGTEERNNPQAGFVRRGRTDEEVFGGVDRNKPDGKLTVTGRFPANLLHDGSDEVVGLFPNTKSGNLNSGHKRGDGTGNSFMGGGGTVTGNYGGDSGSASRFFYCAKSSKSERNKGCEDVITNENGQERVGNIHSTVKPISLMRYLVRLVTPKGGTVLDPFMGSGTTGIGAKLEGFDFIGIEREAEYIKIAEARINAWEKEKQKKLI